MKEKIKPDFVIIPGDVMFSKEIQPLDKTIYGIIYWLEKLKEGRCIASNNYIAEVCDSSMSTIQNSLLRLEKAGFIKRIFKDKEKKIRSEIKTLVSYSVSSRVPSNDGTVPSNSGTWVPSNDDHISNNNISKSILKNITEQSSDDIKQIMDIFYQINPTLNWGNKTYRKSASDLIAKFGVRKACEFASAAIACQNQLYSPTITNPYQLKEKLTQLKKFYNNKKLKSESKSPRCVDLDALIKQNEQSAN